jgi:beta-aspartyl-peptidase (threonine type)
MRTILTIISLLTLMAMDAQTLYPDDKAILVIHGGAGTILKKNMTPEMEADYREKLTEALQAGYDVLKKGGSSMNAVEAAIVVMEDSPLFNAGKGSVFTHDGKNEMDAAVMDGKTLAAGAVAGVHTIKNPIKGARAVMEKSPHVMMIGVGAETFANEQKLEIVDPSYFYDEIRWQQLQKAIKKKVIAMDNSDSTNITPPAKTDTTKVTEDKPDKHGTVGAVALDSKGNLAAGTSTGGMTNKKYGRVGDAPIIGAGTYANNKSCAVSATGHGEYFIRSVVAYDISSLVEYKGLSTRAAAEKVVLEKLVKMGGEGGVIALDKKGNFAMPFNSEGMYRGYVTKEGKIYVAIYKGE